MTDLDLKELDRLMKEQPTVIIELTGVFAAGLVFLFGLGLGVIIGLAV